MSAVIRWTVSLAGNAALIGNFECREYQLHRLVYTLEKGLEANNALCLSLLLMHLGQQLCHIWNDLQKGSGQLTAATC